MGEGAREILDLVFKEESKRTMLFMLASVIAVSSPSDARDNDLESW